MSPIETFSVGEKYTRDQVQSILSVPDAQRDGNWLTGYTVFNEQLYIFCNVGSPGRTGHDYPNKFDGEQLIWSAKSGSTVSQPLMKRMISGLLPTHIFYRLTDRSPFEYAGLGEIISLETSSPVVVRWSFRREPSHKKVLDSEAICSQLQSAGFELGPARVKTRSATKASTTLYVKLDSKAYRLVIDPAYEDRITELANIPGVIKSADFYYHNANLRQFPKRRHTGKRDIPFGFAFDFTSQSALRNFVAALSSEPIQFAPRDSMKGDPKTETEVVRAARLGQQKFRSDLLNYWNGRCALTGFDIPALLRASHIKPWCDSEPNERHDPNNGLLLALHIDGLFDAGFISFDDAGNMLCSERIRQEHLSLLGINPGLRIIRLNREHRKFLAVHRAMHLFHQN